MTTSLTADSGDSFIYQRNGGDLTASAASTNTSGNTRQLYWAADAPSVAAEQSCETWTGSTGSIDQQGIALRIAPAANGLGTRAITVTKNIWELGYWMFNVHVWDTTSATPITLLQTFDMSSIVGPDLDHLVPYPWHVCAHVDSNLFQFMVWTGSNPQPSWDDPLAVRQVALPTGWDYPGYAGWYIGHLEVGSTDTFTELRTASLTGAIDQPTTTSTTANTPTTLTGN